MGNFLFCWPQPGRKLPVEENMDLVAFAQKMEAVLKKAASEYEPIFPAAEDGALWGFELGEEGSGFLSLEPNQGTFPADGPGRGDYGWTVSTRERQWLEGGAEGRLR